MNAPTEQQLTRLPPQSIEAEQSVIGGLLCNSSAWDRIADILTDADFYRDDNRRIFAHIRKLCEAGKPVDVLTVIESIDASNESDQTGGLGYLGEIANAVPSAANIARYAEIVAEKSALRALAAFSAEVDGVAYRQDGTTASERLDSILGRAMDLAEKGVKKSEPRTVCDVMRNVIEQIEERMDRGGAISGLSTGLDDLDEKLDGLKKGDLIVIAGRPSMGKTALAINIAENVALGGGAAMVFSLEMSDTQLVTRSLSSIGSINSRALSSGRLSVEEWDRVTVAMGKLHTTKFIIDQSSSLSVGQMRARARRQKRKTGLDLVVIDYLQLMSAEGNNRNEELGAITRGLKLMARDLDVPVILLSQLSRKCEERADKKPMLSDLRESGSIEQDADVCVMIYRDDYYNENSPYKGMAEALIRKNRMGSIGDVRVLFQPEYSRFVNIDRQALYEADQRAQEQQPVKRSRGFA